MWHLYVCKLMISAGNLSILGVFIILFCQKCSSAVSLATGMHIDDRGIDYVIVCPHTQYRNVTQ